MSSQDSTQASCLKSETKTEETNEDKYQAFSFGRVSSRIQSMVTFKKQDDYVEAISYANLSRVWSSNIETEIRLDFGDRQVLVAGINLKEVFHYLCSNRCSEIVELSTRASMGFPDGQAVVTKLEIQNGC